MASADLGARARPSLAHASRRDARGAGATASRDSAPSARTDGRRGDGSRPTSGSRTACISTTGRCARLGATGIGVAHCPSSNARLGAGMCRVTDLTAAGAPVGLGVDGAASNEDGRLFAEMRQSLYMARQREIRADAFIAVPMRWRSQPKAARVAWGATTSAACIGARARTSRYSPATTSSTCRTRSPGSYSARSSRDARPRRRPVHRARRRSPRHRPPGGAPLARVACCSPVGLAAPEVLATISDRSGRLLSPKQQRLADDPSHSTQAAQANGHTRDRWSRSSSPTALPAVAGSAA